MDHILPLLSDILAQAKQAGADAADAFFVQSHSVSAKTRLEKTDHVERAESIELGLRVFLGLRQAMVATSDMTRESLKSLVERAVVMARVVPENPFAGLAAPEDVAKTIPWLDLDAPHEPSTDALMERALQAEQAALAIPGVTNSEGAEASWNRATVALATTDGFQGQYAKTSHSLYTTAIAGEGLSMETDYESTFAVHESELLSPETVGRTAGERAVRRLNPRRVSSQKVPVVFDPRVSAGLLSHFLSGINGAAIVRGTSFLKNYLHQTIFPKNIAIVDNPLIMRGRRSYAFDGEGVTPAARNLVQQGVLSTWLLDCNSARQLGLRTTGHGSRGPSSPVSPGASNVSLQGGTQNPQDLIAGISKGLYVTQVMGPGVNLVTGDYSRGASGFWIENGQLAYPVTGITIAGHLLDMYRHMIAANDLVRRYGIDAPTLCVESMMVAGQ